MQKEHSGIVITSTKLSTENLRTRYNAVSDVVIYVLGKMSRVTRSSLFRIQTFPVKDVMVLNCSRVQAWKNVLLK